MVCFRCKTCGLRTWTAEVASAKSLAIHLLHKSAGPLSTIDTDESDTTTIISYLHEFLQNPTTGPHQQALRDHPKAPSTQNEDKTRASLYRSPDRHFAPFSKQQNSSYSTILPAAATMSNTQDYKMGDKKTKAAIQHLLSPTTPSILDLDVNLDICTNLEFDLVAEETYEKSNKALRTSFNRHCHDLYRRLALVLLKKLSVRERERTAPWTAERRNLGISIQEFQLWRLNIDTPGLPSSSPQSLRFEDFKFRARVVEFYNCHRQLSLPSLIVIILMSGSSPRQVQPPSQGRSVSSIFQDCSNTILDLTLTPGFTLAPLSCFSRRRNGRWYVGYSTLHDLYDITHAKLPLRSTLEPPPKNITSRTRGECWR